MVKGDAERRHFESLLPWYAAGTLGRSDADRVAQALAADVELARCYSLALEELGMSRLFVEHCEAVAAKINITRRWLGEQ